MPKPGKVLPKCSKLKPMGYVEKKAGSQSHMLTEMIIVIIVRKLN